MADRIDVLIEDMQERQRQLLKLRQPKRRETQAERRLDRIVQGDLSDRCWARKQHRRMERKKVKALGKLGAASPVRKIDPVTGKVIEEAREQT